MNKLLELLALNPQEGDFGLEIEVEGYNLPVIDTKNWKTEEDGSLRGGREYIFRNPVTLPNVPKLLNSLTRALYKAEAELSFSFRTSVHVHMNMQQCSYQQILNTIYTYILLEDPLMNFCGESRKGNRFCLRVEDAEYLITVLTGLFGGGVRELGRIQKDITRYSAINIESLRKYGSLEFRAMEGNLNVSRLTTWVTALNNIREFACSHANPTSIYNQYIAQEGQAFADTVLKDVAPAFAYPDMVRGIQRNFSLSLDLPFAYSKAFNQKAKVIWDAPEKEGEEDKEAEEEDRE